MREPSKIKIGEYTLEEILERHKHWLNEDCEGWENMKADLNNIDLSNANLRYVDLRYVTMCNANLSNSRLYCADLFSTDLSCVNLYGVDLNRAVLSHANLSNVNLQNADLRDAILYNSNLYNANLSCANLSNANLSCANLSNANLSCANLSNAYLSYADLSYVNLHDANLIDAKNIPYIPLACPSEGSFIAWKRVQDHLIKLNIPASAKRSSATTQKCRASKVKVLGIYTLDGEKTKLKNIVNRYEDSVIDYTVGKTVYPDSFDENRWNECSHGIHFFINKQDAINY